MIASRNGAIPHAARDARQIAADIERWSLVIRTTKVLPN